MRCEEFIPIMTAKSSSRFWILPLLLIGVVVCVAIAYFEGFFARDGLCIVLPGTAADGFATAKVQTWDDLNGNGILDSGEPPLPWVTINIGWASSITNSDGNGSVGIFKPGCACNCWENESVKVLTPVGRRATTATEFELTGDKKVYQFGFQQDDTQHPVFTGEPGWSQAFLNRGILLSAFDYDDSQRYLSIELKSDTGQDKEQIYTDIFDIINSLMDSNIVIKRVSIAFDSIGNKTTCELDKVRDLEGGIFYTKILKSYCQHP